MAVPACAPVILVRNDSQPEFLPGLAQTIIDAEEQQSRDRRPGSERRRKMDRIERSNRFARKRLPGALHDLWRDTQDLPVRCRRGQVRASLCDPGAAGNLPFAKPPLNQERLSAL
jgi:hypothetical protein